MADSLEKNKVSMEEMDDVSGGTRAETYDDSYQLYRRGLLDKKTEDCAVVREALFKLGYTNYKDKGGFIKSNIYADKLGNKISRDQFWANFDKENGTRIIRN